MAQQSGIEIHKRFYPWPTSFRLGDPVLVKEITGMSWPEFLTALHEQEDAFAEAREMGLEPPAPDQVVTAGVIAVAFWQGNPTMTRDKVRRSLERTDVEDIEIIEGDEEVDVGPPAQEGGGSSSTPSTISNASADSPEVLESENPLDSSLDVTSPNGSGHPGSLTTSPESLPA